MMKIRHMMRSYPEETRYNIKRAIYGNPGRSHKIARASLSIFLMTSSTTEMARMHAGNWYTQMYADNITRRAFASQEICVRDNVGGHAWIF